MEVPQPRISDIVNPPTPGSERLPFAPNLDITKVPQFLMKLLQLADPTGMMLGGASQGMQIAKAPGAAGEGINLLDALRNRMPVLSKGMPESVASRAQQNPLSQALFQKQFEPTGAALQKLTGVQPSEDLAQSLFQPTAVHSSIASPREASYAQAQKVASDLQKRYPRTMQDVKAEIGPESWASTKQRTQGVLGTRVSENDPFGVTKKASVILEPEGGILPYSIEGTVGHEYEGHRVMNMIWDQEATNAKLKPVEKWQLKEVMKAQKSNEGVAEWVAQQQSKKAGIDRTPIMGHGAKQNKVYTQLEKMEQYDNPITTARNYIKGFISDFKDNTLPTLKKEPIHQIMDRLDPVAKNVAKSKYTDKDIGGLIDSEMKKVISRKQSGVIKSYKGGGMTERDIPKVPKEEEGIPRPSGYDPKTGARSWEFNQPKDLKFEDRTIYQQERYSPRMQPEDEMIVATQGGKDVGMLWVRKTPGGGFTVSRVAVDKPYQRQGIASDLMREAESKFGKSKGATTAETPAGKAFTEGRSAKAKVEGHHTLPVGGKTNMDALDWHLRNLWETPGSPGGWRTIEDVTPEWHKELTRRQRLLKPQSRQYGGPVEADQPYVVGEKGPEVIVPDKSGYVIPEWAKGKIGGMGQLMPGQFAPQEGFIKLYTPEPDDVNPKLGSLTHWVESMTMPWDKRCEWHPWSF
jgi:GNAT superfamily N-acetyltransferase